MARKGNLILEHEDLSYASLVDSRLTIPTRKKMALARVKSFDPERSFLIRKLKGMGPGDAMPQGGGMLPDETIKMIEDWIARGAHSRQEECVTKAPDADDRQDGTPQPR